ncbi:hypothetical protein AM501_26880 [Aneurinibacillus migulanus]|uniref:heavy metal-binding domain-containing protein n=1 Tax=Aneurinibacillus migulanus TaxID=47500 RepID=UPI0005BE7FCF|nr:heavy metal-binding domain-containing protein [Aneurinibacillus migulanus]KIV55057.1 hypothetical protein TS64_12315 [Aneurinibacillus migulanus]KPD05342.1 hypothetical protein AM501_26880 [Aneurinibacillus migulanus]
MALFGKKEKQEKLIVEQEKNVELDMLVSTIDNIGRPYEALGLVTARTTKLMEFNHNIVVQELVEEAQRIGADAIVGFRYVISNSGNITDVISYGTAVKLK